ncbi:MAG: hypothetical protein BMS9Abin32_275 [Gammaproteobacteria bacterium]|nr:MAG: hypothetical protein BMS9Abin32_275 [Gammaproteobacteria bacterium]
MALLRNTLILLSISWPLAAPAAVAPGELPAGTVWYLHADLEQMRNSVSGRELYKWLDGKVFMEIHEEIGIDINKETDAVTAFSDRDRGTVVLVEGKISQDTQDKLLAIATLKAKLQARDHKGKAYYYVRDDADAASAGGDDGESMNDFDGEAYFSFAVPGRLIITSDAEQMGAILDNDGRITGSQSHEGAIFVLTADRAFVQAGLRTDSLDNDADSWKSNIIRNTEQAALLVSAREELIAVEAQLVSRDPAIAASIGGIVNGLIGLQAFNTELSPELRSLIRNTRIEVKENVLTIDTVIDPSLVLTVLNE